MKKALAQNPNLLRTLIGLSLTLIFMLSYAVYGATVSPSVYIYKTDATVNEYSASSADEDVERTYDVDENTTTWAWQVIANDANDMGQHNSHRAFKRCGVESDQCCETLQSRTSRNNLHS